MKSLWTPEIRGGYVPVVGDKRASIDNVNSYTGTAPDVTFRNKSNAFTGSYATVGAGLKIKLADKFIADTKSKAPSEESYRRGSVGF